ncbi:MAG: SMC-Scp complex subunit ScpB [Candidatus Moranbacteria bacterium]|nr:SMC-Scp complex subunit ScpB [Candidatus Moranbacteria bacterium]NTW76003.1 SMC-Scp complex subunit ScpB [Candidatus Moranbacteria bacterium]
MSTDHTTTIVSKIESLLFLHGEPLSFGRLSKALNVSETEIVAGVKRLSERYVDEDSGLFLIENNNQVGLATRPENAVEVEAMLVADREETLGKATMETLAVVAYRGPVTRASIDAIRGVNSSFALRNLSLRGLIDRRTNPFDAREYEYVPSFRLFELLGLSSAVELADYDALSKDSRLTAREQSADVATLDGNDRDGSSRDDSITEE